MGKYDDIIHLTHHVSSTRPHMPMTDRAAQFMPFRALTGYEDAVRETARYTDERIELTEDEKALLDICVTGQLKKIDDHEGYLILTGGERILIEDILEII